jgi:NAD(P)-dependent dehydrogenase (short-subunit alcohol dehydrogenase family)
VPDSVFITGGADSIGRAVAEACLARGDRVYICDIRPEALSDTLRANPDMRGATADVGDISQLDAALDEALDLLGPITVLVNNVGAPGERAPLDELSLEAWRATFDVNVTAPLRAMQRVAPGMRAVGGGAIVNISTGSTRTRLPLRTPYVASKFALEGLTLNAARELGPSGIRCNAILPGMLNNDRMRRIVEQAAAAAGRSAQDVEADYLRYISLRTKIEPQEIAATVLFLGSEAGAKITGELLSVSGNIEWEI